MQATSEAEAIVRLKTLMQEHQFTIKSQVQIINRSKSFIAVKLGYNGGHADKVRQEVYDEATSLFTQVQRGE